MSAFIGIASTEGTKVASGTSLKTILQIVAAANHRVKLLGFNISFFGIAAAAVPVQVAIVRQSTAGTSAALTPVKEDDSLAETLQTAARKTITAEPTTGDVLEVFSVHPQQSFTYVFPEGHEPICGGGDRLGLRVLAAATVDCEASLKFEE